MRKKLLSVLLALSMLLALAPVSVLAAGDETSPEKQTIKVRDPGVEDGDENVNYASAYKTAGLELSSQAEDGSYTLTIDKEKLEAIVAKGRNDPTYKILENASNPYQLWFGMEYKKPDSAQSAVKAKVQFDGKGDFVEVELDNENKDGFYNYIKVYKGNADSKNGEIGPVEKETARIKWLGADGNELAVTEAVVKVEVKDSVDPLAPTLDFDIPDADDDLMEKQVEELYEYPETGGAITVGTPLADGKIPVTVHGTVKQVSWPEFGEEHKSEAMKSGYYLPLKLTPTPADCVLKVTKGDSTDDFGVMTDPDDNTGSVTLTTWLNGLEDNGYKFEITVSKDGQDTTYLIDCSGIIPGANPPETQAYTITFDGNGGNDTVTVDPSSAVTKNGKLESLPAPTRNGYTLKGWFTEANGGTEVTLSTEFNASVTIYAQWTKNGTDQPDDDKDKEYTVTFDSQGGTDVKEKEVKVKSGEKVTEPIAPTREGYKFAGWFKDGDSAKFDFGTAITGNITLKAKWEKDDTGNKPSEDKDEYTITVRSGIRNGSVYLFQEYAEPGDRVTFTVDPDTDYQVDWVEAVRENGGWIYLSQNGRRYTFTMPASDVTVDAGFELRAVYTSYTYYQPVETAANRAPSTPVFTQSAWRPAAVMKDIPANSWAYAPAQWAYQNGYLDMSADGTFRLNDPVSHRQMWKIMAQWLNAPAMDDRELTGWATQNGAAAGNLADGSMTRQNVVTYLHQCCFLMGGDMSASGNLGQYPDARLITSASSQKAWTWAVSKGIISGTSDGYLNPNGLVSRGELAAILMRLSQNVMK